MKYKLIIECGETTCALEPGKFCRFLGTTHFGTRNVCLLFRCSYDNCEPLFENKDGWLARCSQCLEALVEEK